MNSRDRVKSILDHKNADSIPISLGSSIVDGLTKYAKDNLESYLGLEITPYIGLWDVFLTAVGDYADIVCQGDDLAMQDRSIVPLDIYNKHIKKYHKRIYDFIKSKTTAKIFHHSCGSVFELIPGLIDAGVDILNPVQTSAKNMEPVRLKKLFGRDLTFWGGLDTQKILPYGTIQQIRDEVKRLLEILGKDGGYVFAPGHNIQALVRPGNVHAMMSTAAY